MATTEPINRDGNQNAAPAGTPPSEDTAVQKTDDASVTTPEPIKVGNKTYKDASELVGAYGELEKKLGSQGNEVGDLRRKTQELAAQLEETRKAAEAKNEAPKTDHDQMMAEIQKQVDEGELSVEEAIFKTSEITAAKLAEQAAITAQNTINQALQERDQAQAIKEFHQANPKFAEVQASGILEQYKAQNPMEDDLSAFRMWERDQAFEAGKAAQSQIEAGAQQTDNVLTKPGQTIRQTNTPKPVTVEERKASMLAAINAAGGGG